MAKFDFETLHPNHKWAFIDGLLVGVIVVGFAWTTERYIRSNKL